jgi:hypothetical protein
LVLDVDDPGMYAGADDAAGIRAAADMLAERGLVLEVVSQGRGLITLGAVAAPWWQRRITKSRHIRLGSARGAWTSARSPRRTTPPAVGRLGWRAWSHVTRRSSTTRAIST